MKIINKHNNETVATILGGENLTLDEVINLVGEIINDTNDDRWSDDGDNVIIGDDRYWYEDLELVGAVESDKTYYLPTADHWHFVFQNAEVICIDREEAERLYNEWYGDYGADIGDEFDDLWREADADEIEEYGVYNS